MGTQFQTLEITGGYLIFQVTIIDFMEPIVPSFVDHYIQYPPKAAQFPKTGHKILFIFCCLLQF